MQGPCFQYAGKDVKFFLASSVSFSSCYHDFYLLLNDILSKEKLKIEIIMNFYYLSLYCAMPVFKCKSTYLVCQITEITQFVFHSSFIHVYLVLFGTVKTLHKTNSTVFLSLFETLTFYQHFLSSFTDE